MTRKKERRLKSRNNTHAPCKTGVSHVSYCPTCVAPDAQRPQGAPHIQASPRTRTGRCANGHEWPVTGSIYR
jgi:hypothetical protein